jgi:hypothetical protein
LAEPLHPDVQEAYLKLIRASAEKFASYSSFKGITIIAGNMFYKSDEDGYGDFPVMEFERETGLKIPVEANAGARFAKRYEWLMGNARERWISWRAGKLADFYRRLSDELQTLAPGRKLQLMASSAWKPFASWPDFDLKDYWFKRGIDQEALRSIPYFSIMPVIEPYTSASGWISGAGQHLQERTSVWLLQRASGPLRQLPDILSLEFRSLRRGLRRRADKDSRLRPKHKDAAFLFDATAGQPVRLGALGANSRGLQS